MRSRIRGWGCRVLLALVLLVAGPASIVAGAETWQGVDKTVVEKYAKEQGREARQPLINTDQGDLLLFLFLVAGAAAGFAAGYYWRELTGRKHASAGKDGHASS